MILLILIAWCGAATACVSAYLALRAAAEAAWASAIASGDMQPDQIKGPWSLAITLQVAERLAARRMFGAAGWAAVSLMAAAVTGAALSSLIS